MKGSWRLLTAAAVCVMLTGCGTDAADQTESLPNYEINVADLMNSTTAPQEVVIATGTYELDSAAEAVTEAAETVTEAVTGSDADSGTASAAPTPEQNQNGYDMAQIFDDSGFAAIACTGEVTAPDGLNLRETPGTAGKKITTLEDGTQVDVLGLSVSGNVYDYNARWLKVRAGGQEGYALAEYIAAECSTPAEQLSDRERAALGTILYYQSLHLYPDYHRKGGPRGTYTDEFKDGFCRVMTKGKASAPLTLDNLKKEFHRYFSVNCYDDLDKCYLEDSGKLYVLVGYGDNVSLDYVCPESMSADGSTLNYTIRVHHVPEFADEDFPEWDYDLFRLVYEDGSWKTAVIKEEY